MIRGHDLEWGQGMLKCTVTGPFAVAMNEPLAEAHAGCKVYEIRFPRLAQVDEIFFHNQYCACATVRVKRRLSDQVDAEWETSGGPHTLMPSPHLEKGAQDHFRLTPAPRSTPWHPLNALLLVLRQPSPVWRRFDIQDIYVTGRQVEQQSPSLPPAPPSVPSSSPTPASHTSSSSSSSEEDAEQDNEQRIIPCRPPPGRRLMSLWSLGEESASRQSNALIANFEVGRSYDINLLL